jgi:DinB superfamily
VTIEPDTKDWTWVLERRCDECGFDGSSTAAGEVASLIRDNVTAWRPLVDRSGVAVRPSPDRWSALEYACHVRDVYRLYDERLALMLAEDDPGFANWDQDATAVEDRYGEQDPTTVVADLEAAGAALADRFDRVPADGWQRTGTRSDGARFTIDTFARYLVHDPIHHLHDVRQGFAKLDRQD